MAKISLRSYTREIEGLIDHNQIDEAIAHCKYILKIFPKHIDTYRLLGKAYIEKQRYGEASDILQRILSVIPDDFISQAGMSIIREDEKNLDAAIWHMERAFEVQPSNASIQNELRRLYGRRDGVEPSKMRMTRGALVRMYARGDLYAQAISEAQAAVKEDSNRPDLEVILARMHFMSHQLDEAEIICKRLIRKLPFCYEANRILADISSKKNPTEAEACKQNIFALDPYTNFVSSAAPNPAQIPDNAVMLERLDWHPSLGEEKQPDWATTAGIEFEDTGEASDHEAGSEGAIPDWMKAAGWSETGEGGNEPSTSEASSTPMQIQTETKPRPDKTQPVKIPQTPSEKPKPDGDIFDESDTSEIGDLPSSEESIELPDWLNQIGIAEQPEVVDETSNINLEQTETIAASQKDTEFEEGFAWLENLAAKQGADESSLINTAEERDTTAPAWLASDQTETNENSAPVSNDNLANTAEEELPDWLQEMAQTPLPEEPENHQSEIDELLKAAKTDNLQEPIKAPEGSREDLVTQANDDELPDWLQEMANTPLAEPEDHQSEIDELLKVANREQTGISENFPGAAGAEGLPEGQNLIEEAIPEQVPNTISQDVFDEQVVMADEEQHGIDLQVTPPIQESETSSQIVEEEVLPKWLQEDELHAVSETFEHQDDIDKFLQTAKAEISGEESTTKSVLPVDNLNATSESLANLTLSPTQETGLSIDSFEGDKVSDSSTISEAALENFTLEGSPLKIPEEFVMDESDDDLQKILLEYVESEHPTQPVDQQGDIDQLLKSSMGETETDAIAPDEIEKSDILEQPVAAEAMNEWRPEIEDIESNIDIEQLLGKADQGAEPDLIEAPAHGTLDIGVQEKLAAIDQNLQEIEEGTLPEWLLEEALPTNAELGDHQAEIDQLLSNDDVEISELRDVIQVNEKMVSEPEIFAEENPLPEWVLDRKETPFGHEQDTVKEPLPSWVLEEPEKAALPKGKSTSYEPTDNLPSWVQEIGPDFSTRSRKAITLAPPEASIIRNIAQKALDKGELETAIKEYHRLISSHTLIEETIADITSALHRYPVDSSIWQILGDAYSQCDRLQDALNAYTKAEEMLR